MFGSVASVRRYNVFSRILVTITRQPFGIPTDGRVDECDPICPTSIGEKVMETFHQMAEINGIKLKKKKASFGQTDTISGVEWSAPTRSNVTHSTVGLPIEKRRIGRECRMVS